MKEQLQLVIDFHKKFNAPIGEKPEVIKDERSELRYRLMKEEVDEYYTWTKEKDLPNIAKEIADILYTVLGTIVEHWLQDKIEDIFREVHESNMSKEYHEYKMVKGANYFKADIEKFFKKGT